MVAAAWCGGSRGTRLERLEEEEDEDEDVWGEEEEEAYREEAEAAAEDDEESEGEEVRRLAAQLEGSGFSEDEVVRALKKRMLEQARAWCAQLGPCSPRQGARWGSWESSCDAAGWV